MTMRPGHRHGWAALTGAALTASLAAAALASTPNPGPKGSPPVPAPATRPADGAKLWLPEARTPVTAPSPGSIGLMAFLDPETGLLTGPIGSLVPPADQRAAAANVMLQAVQRPNGAWLLDLQGTMLDYYVIHVDALGRRTISCAQDPRHVHAAAPLPAAPVAVER